MLLLKFLQALWLVDLETATLLAPAVITLCRKRRFFADFRRNVTLRQKYLFFPQMIDDFLGVLHSPWFITYSDAKVQDKPNRLTKAELLFPCQAKPASERNPDRLKAGCFGNPKRQ